MRFDAVKAFLLSIVVPCLLFAQATTEPAARDGRTGTGWWWWLLALIVIAVVLWAVAAGRRGGRGATTGGGTTTRGTSPKV